MWVNIISISKNKTIFLPYTLYKNQVKMDYTHSFVRLETVKLLEEGVRKFFSVGLGNDFLGMTPKA